MFLNLKNTKDYSQFRNNNLWSYKKFIRFWIKNCPVEDSNKKFLGVLNDGDIRRAFLRGGGLNTTIEKFVNKKSIHINHKYEKNLKKLNTLKKFNEPIPVIKNKKFLV